MFRLLIGIAVLMLGAVVYFEMQHPSSAVPTPEARQVAAQAAAPTAASGEVRAELTEQTITDRLNQRLVGQPLGNTPFGPSTLAHVAVVLKTGQILATGDAQVGAASVPLSVTGHMVAQSGRTLVVVDDARAAGIPLPDATRQSMQQVIQDQVDQEVSRTQMRVTSVTIADGKLVVLGAPKR